MTIVDVLNNYPNIDITYCKTRIPMVDKLPETYRWADEVECEYWWHIPGALNVIRGGSAGNYLTDLAVPQN